jgi:hypothetical protein
MGNLLNSARNLIKKIATDSTGWAVDILLRNPTGTEFEIKGLHTKHHLGQDTDGVRVNSKNAHISFYESDVIALGGSIRNSKGEVKLKDWRVNVADSTGTTKTYVINEWFPNETTGLVVCILGDLIV